MIDTRSFKEGRTNHLQDTLSCNRMNFERFAQIYIQKGTVIAFVADLQSQPVLTDFNSAVKNLKISMLKAIHR